MAIKIPLAIDAGLGQRLPEVVPQPVKKVLPAYVPPALAPSPDLDRIAIEGEMPLLMGQTISKGFMGTSQIGMDIALNQIAHEDRLQIMQKLKEENTLEEIANIILDNKYRLCSDCRKGWEDGRDNNRD